MTHGELEQNPARSKHTNKKFYLLSKVFLRHVAKSKKRKTPNYHDNKLMVTKTYNLDK